MHPGTRLKLRAPAPIGRLELQAMNAMARPVSLKGVRADCLRYRGTGDVESGNC
jgi:hypothetical protein